MERSKIPMLGFRTADLPELLLAASGAPSVRQMFAEGRDAAEVREFLDLLHYDFSFAFRCYLERKALTSGESQEPGQ